MERPPLNPGRLPRSQTGRVRAIVTAIATVSVFACVLAACGNAPAAPLGRTPAEARANTHDLFGAFALRMGPLTRSPELARIRPQYVRGSLVPSRIYDRVDLWTSRSGNVRTLTVAGTPLPDGRYALDVSRDAPSPARAGDSRHVMELRRLGDDDVYEWRSLDELAIGEASAAGLEEMRHRFLGAAEGRSGRELRAAWHLSMPRTTAALSRLYAVDSVVTTPLADGSTAVSLLISVHPERLGASFPDYEQWMRKYVGASRHQAILEDYAGARFVEMAGGRGLLRIRLRTKDGILQPLRGPVRAGRADSLRLRMDVATRIRPFTVGAKEIVADLVAVREPRERGWMLRWRHEPEWDFPLAVDHLMRDALRRPFTGEGTWMRVVARETPEGQTLIVRDFRMEVQESAIVRWLNRLGSSAMSEVTSRVEYQKDRFFAEALRAIGEDLAAQLGGAPATRASGT